MIVRKIVEDIVITNMKRIYSIKDKLNYKVNPQSVESEGLEPSSKQTIKLLSTCLFFI